MLFPVLTGCCRYFGFTLRAQSWSALKRQNNRIYSQYDYVDCLKCIKGQFPSKENESRSMPPDQSYLTASFSSSWCSRKKKTTSITSSVTTIFKETSLDMVTRRKTSFSVSLSNSILTISLTSIYKHDAIDIADPSSMQAACQLSGRASERGIRRSEVWFLMGTQNFFFVPRSWQDENIFLYFLRHVKILTSARNPQRVDSPRHVESWISISIWTTAHRPLP